MKPACSGVSADINLHRSLDKSSAGAYLCIQKALQKWVNKIVLNVIPVEPTKRWTGRPLTE